MSIQLVEMKEPSVRIVSVRVERLKWFGTLLVDLYLIWQVPYVRFNTLAYRNDV